MLLVFAVSCIKEDHFGYSDKADVVKIELSIQSGPAKIYTENDSIYIEVAHGADLSSIIVNKLELSSFATATLKEGDVLNFEDEDKYFFDIISESGSKSTWSITVFEQDSKPQIDNSDFNLWHNRGQYFDLGLSDASSSWATSNPGPMLLSISNVEPCDTVGEDYAVKMQTKYISLGAMMGIPIAAGSVFTGDFDEANVGFTNPQASVDFGIPFTGTPSSFSIDFRYTRGENNINASGETLPYEDTGDMYILLEERNNDKIKRVATAWVRIEENVSSMQNITVDFIYGELPFDTPDYKLPQKGETYAEEGTKPTHVVAVFTSSAYGNDFQGAEGSTLIIDNLVLNYD